MSVKEMLRSSMKVLEYRWDIWLHNVTILGGNLTRLDVAFEPNIPLLCCTCYDMWQHSATKNRVRTYSMRQPWHQMQFIWSFSIPTDEHHDALSVFKNSESFIHVWKCKSANTRSRISHKYQSKSQQTDYGVV